MGQTENFLWWQEGIIYEIYVRSFQDSNGDGIGDLQGILQRLDYLQWLGVTALWLTPIYPSPMKDFGYDISDYKGIHSIFGSLEDFKKLLNEVHQRGMKLIMDLVPNHTSDMHPWFQESRSSKNNPKRDWYYWKEGKRDGSEPNNWLSVLGGSAWQLDEKTEEYYYHTFLKEQPDLNLRNPEVINAIEDVMRFWLDLGVDGFRIDVMWYLIKDDKWRENPANPNYSSDMPDCDKLLQIFSSDQPEVHDVIRHMREVMDEYQERVMIGEIYLPIDKIVSYYGKDNKGAHLPANFQLLFSNWKADELNVAIDQYEARLTELTWPNWVIGNHDKPRVSERIGKDKCNIAALLLLTLRGTPTLYYGDEIGMEQVPIPEEEVQDPQGLLMPGKNFSRDPQRTPMQWNRDKNAGFTTAKPWLRLSDNFSTINVQNQKEEKNSLLMFYKKLIDLRQGEPSLKTGDYFPLYADAQLLIYIRKQKGYNSYLIAVNLSDKEASWRASYMDFKGKIMVSTTLSLEGTDVNGGITLRENEGIVVCLGIEDEVN